MLKVLVQVYNEVPVFKGARELIKLHREAEKMAAAQFEAAKTMPLRTVSELRSDMDRLRENLNRT